MTGSVCKGCKERFVGCHGKREDGSWRCPRWRCPRWGEAQEKKDEELRRTERDRMQTAVMERYTRENRYRFTKGK